MPVGAASAYAIGRTEDEQFERFIRARRIRAERNATRLASAASYAPLGFAASLQAHNSAAAVIHAETEAGHALAADAAVNAFEMRMAAGGASMRGEDWATRLTRRRIASRLEQMPEMHGRVSGEQLGKWAAEDSAGLRGAASMAMGAGAVGVVGGALVGEKSLQSLEAASARNVEFHNDLKKLASLGDNAGNVGKLRDDVLAYSAAWGVASSDITAAMYKIQSAGGDLSKQEREEVLRGACSSTRWRGPTSAPLPGR